MIKKPGTSGLRGSSAFKRLRDADARPGVDKADAKVEAKKSEGAGATQALKGPAHTDEMQQTGGAKAALRSLAMDVRSPEVEKQNKGAESATFGARVMDWLKGPGGKKAYAFASLGMTLMGMAKPAAAAAMPVEQAQQVIEQQQVLNNEATQTSEGFVRVNANEEALDNVFSKAEAGELDVSQLILESPDGKLPSSWKWNQLKQKYPKAFEQVEQVHVVKSQASTGYNSGALPGDLFPNAKAVMTLDLSSSIDGGPASSWVIDQTTQTLEDMGSDLSPQDALLKAKALANVGVSQGLTVTVDVQGQKHEQAPENVLGDWLDTRSEDTDAGPITKQELTDKLLELSEGDDGLTSGMLGLLNQRMNQSGFKMDYDAARMARQLIDVRQVGGQERALEALKNGNVAEVRHEMASELHGAGYVEERSELFSTDIVRGVPLAGDEAIPTGGLQGSAFLVDGLGSIKNGEVNVQAIHHPKHGDGYQLTFKLGDKAGHEVEGWLRDHGDARLIDKTIVNHAPTDDGRVVTAEKSDGVDASGVIENQRPEMSLGPALRMEKGGEFRVDYFPESLSKQAVRGEIHIQVYGETDAQRKENARDVLADLGLQDAVQGQPSEETEEKLKALRLLEQADPRAHHAIMERLDNGEAVGIEEMHNALVAAEVPPAFLQQAYFGEASPGHMSVIVPGQSEAYGRRGVRGVYHTISKPEIFAYIANDGALMSTKDRLAVGKVFRGMSSDTDLRTGGADYVFTRQVNESMGNPSMSGMRGGAIVMKEDVLDRADWYAYSGDKYGTTLTGDRGELTDEVKEVAKRTYDELKEAGDSSVQNKDFDQWLDRMLKKQTDSRQNTYLPRAVGRTLVDKTTGSSNETMLEGTIPISQIKEFLVRTQEAKDKTVAKLHELGVTEINGEKVEDFIKVRDNFFSDEAFEAMEAEEGPQVTDPSQHKEQDQRLQFYVKNVAPAADNAPKSFIA
jgi:hypothetical protein